MKADLAKLRALHAEILTGIDPPEWSRACLQIVQALPELLAIAEAVERAPVVELALRDDDRGNDWLECRYVTDWNTMNALNGQRVRLLAIGEE